MNAARLRELLTHVEDNPAQLDLTTYGEQDRACGIVADLAGWTLILRGWTLVADKTFKSPDGEREICGWQDIEREACAALGLSEDDLWGGSDIAPLFGITDPDEALSRLRELTETAEAVLANG